VQQATKQSAPATAATAPVAGVDTKSIVFVKRADLNVAIFGPVQRLFVGEVVLRRIMLPERVRLGLVLGCLSWDVISHPALQDIKCFANVMGREDVNWT
jgi:hypothetical protein